VKVSVLILTFNEEINLSNCLDSVSEFDDIIILDSYSTDSTVSIAKSKGARVFQRKFDNFANQRNYALKNLTFKNDWILHLDADEIVTSKLIGEIKQKIPNKKYDAFRLPSKIMFLGKWLRFSGMYPIYQVRLGHYKKLNFKQFGHGQIEDMDIKRIGIFKEPYMHYTFTKGIDEWINKHNNYSSDEAKQNLIKGNQNFFLEIKNFISMDSTKRRRALKALSRYLPFRSLFRFFYMYILRLGFLDGYPGYIYCKLIAIYENMIDIKFKINKFNSKK
jgi:glycosyltransferase involved in cell wall biosynthesis